MTLLDEVCHDVKVEPKLQSLGSESFHNKTITSEDDSRLDIKTNGLWTMLNPALDYAKISTTMLKVDDHLHEKNEKNVRQQQLPSITEKIYIIVEDCSFFTLPLRNGRFYLLSNSNF